MGDLVVAAIPARLEVVPKALTTPASAAGHVDWRAALQPQRALHCVWMARWRYGDDTDMAFIGTEFLLPSERAAFDRDGASALPATPGKCLVCSRYLHTYVYRQARSNPAFCPSASLPLQAYGNPLGVAKGEALPTHSSSACGADGYRPEALLFVDEAWADTAAARGSMSSFLWRPCVKFLPTHYQYVKDPTTGLPRLLQRGVGSDVDSVAHFRQPVPERPAALGLASTHKPAAPMATTMEREEEEEELLIPSEDEDQEFPEVLTDQEGEDYAD